MYFNTLINYFIRLAIMIDFSPPLLFIHQLYAKHDN